MPSERRSSTGSRASWIPRFGSWGRWVRTPAFATCSPPFSTRWSEGFRIVATRANGTLALAFYRRGDTEFQPSSLQLVSAVDGKLSEIVSFIGVEYFRGFGLPQRIAA